MKSIATGSPNLHERLTIRMQSVNVDLKTSWLNRGRRKDLRNKKNYFEVGYFFCFAILAIGFLSLISDIEELFLNLPPPPESVRGCEGPAPLHQPL